jgi:septal ring factor EnvC (AmiA/AmiB activator)
MNQGMMRNRKRENKRRSITPMPNKFPMSVTRRQLPPPVEKSKGESDAEKRLKVLTKQLKNGEQERDELKQTVEKLKKSITELKNKPNEIQKLLDLFHYDNVEELQNEIIKYRVAKQKAKKRMIRYAERQS